MTCVGSARYECHPSQDHHLLGVLLAEVRMLRADEPEQDGDHGRHAIEMARPSGTLQGPRDGAHGDEGVEPRVIDLLDGRRPDEVDAFLGTDRHVACLAARVTREVGRIAELTWVHEDRGHAGGVRARAWRNSER